MDSSGTSVWLASIALYPSVKSLSVDASEQNVYFSGFVNPLVVLILSAGDGSIKNQHTL